MKPRNHLCEQTEQPTTLTVIQIRMNRSIGRSGSAPTMKLLDLRLWVLYQRIIHLYQARLCGAGAGTGEEKSQFRT
jgi:hypothetical protein